ncbi:E3 ubiquitin-protein ligase SHPRH isoform X2 [Amia ocellicauda]|uniref:E3 ubiquitin-protein ligase SHPRH isoform X2 n=1 Tax=Amia ocellicauda TaxID=2972642 RepID=UPI0034643BFB
MSNRRKRAPPVRVDEEAKKKLSWNMEDLRSEDVILVEDESNSRVAPLPSVSEVDLEEGCSSALVQTVPSPVWFSEPAEEPPCPPSDIPTPLTLKVLPCSELDLLWKALIGEFSLHVKRYPIEVASRSFTLQRSNGELSVHLLQEGEGDGLERPGLSEELVCQVKSSFAGPVLEDLVWLQKRGVIQLCHKTADDSDSIQLGIFILEAGLGKPEFLSEGNGRIRKANQLIQKLMELFYDFIIPEYGENEEEEPDTDLERQNIEELYDYVRHFHQNEGNDLKEDIQHPGLIPVLRPYQCQAVNWMLRREKYKSEGPQEKSLHFLWREVSTLCGKTLFYNPYTGCLTHEYPVAGNDWPGGILADEMGLGKTVEVLALILYNTRQGLCQQGLILPEGRSVNYFVPPRPPTDRKEKQLFQKCDMKPKEKITHPAVRVMLVTAVKEMKKPDPCRKRAHRRPQTVSRKPAEEDQEAVVQSGKSESPAQDAAVENSMPLSPPLAEHNYCDLNKEGAAQLSSSKGGVPENKTEDEVPVDRHHSSVINYEEAHSSSLQIMTDKRCEATVKDEDTVKSDSHASIPARTATVLPFNTSNYRFECICGELGLIDYKARVQCLNCFLWQHAECVNYKEESLGTTPFYCPHCLVAMTPVPTGATLIISPSSICHQWVEEIKRHLRSSSLRVLVYQGVKKHGFIQPHVLAEQDVVITTYDVLRTELNYVDIPHSNSEDGRRFRNQKRYMAVPSPLVAVEWWRVCLDEAQMVECTTAKAAEMALRLSSINRWCVSGTPVQRGLEDLYGLVLFLGVDPYWVKHWWDQLLYRPYRRGNSEPLYNVIGRFLWRSAKKDVIDQIQIPSQTEEIHWLNFSPVEGHFYHRQHEVCSQDALVKLRKISDWTLKLGSLDRRTVNSILYPLLRLRQACCHPQAVRGEFLPFQKSTMTMEELLKSLQKKCRVECEEAHRQLVCALNGLSGIHIIRGEYLSAVELYREVLRSSEEHKDKLKTDSLQRLHATHNLMELLNAKHPGIPPTLRDDRLKEEADELRKHYMTKSNSEVADAHQALQPVLQTIRELKRKIHPGSPWWLDVIQRALQYAVDDDLVLRVQNELTCNYKQQASKLSMADKFRDSRGLQFLLSSQMDDLIKAQKAVRDGVKKLEGPPSRAVIEETTICHLRPVRLPLNNCVFCRTDELFTDYESKLFSHTVKGQTAIFEEMIEDEEGLVDDRLPTTSRGLWATSETERALKAVLSFAKARRMEAGLIEEGNTFMELFESWKKEYKLLHEYWMVLRDHVSAIDELGMATERLRVRHPDEPKPKVLHIIEPHEVEQNRVKLLNDRAVAKSQLQKKLGQLLYLTNLEKSQDKSTGGLNPEPCPICARPLGQQWAVLTCGHCFCNECIAIIVEQYSVGTRRRAIKCAICRQTTSHTEISYVFTAETASEGQEIPVKGSHSTKVEAVVRALKKIHMTDPAAKSLVFSTWQGVLDIIAQALYDNNMDFSQINGIHKFQENLSSFKYEEKINILLLPLHTGSNGLNIIEATHVLLVEPILNPAHELQAIGRVHRIGQTKPTFVHRFLIKSTIEERMQAMLKTAERSHGMTSMKHSEAAVLTVADLADLFTEDTETLE